MRDASVAVWWVGGRTEGLVGRWGGGEGMGECRWLAGIQREGRGRGTKGMAGKGRASHGLVTG